MDPLQRALRDRIADPRRVDDYYGPIAEACARRLASSSHRPWVLGIQGPQGCGKSTLASALVDAFGDTGVRGLAVSIDEFYLTHAEQRALAARHPGNPYLLYRGYPGTHDVAMGSEVLAGLRALGPGEETRIPVYDKSAHEGRGDRAPESKWRRVVGPLDLLIIEGWMLGFSAAPDEAVDDELRVANGYLRAYDAWTAKLDAFLQLDVDGLETIVDWRVDAERARRERGEAGLSDDDARDYIERFLPAYRVYVPRLRERPPEADSMRVVLRPDRMPATRPLLGSGGPSLRAG